MSANCDVSVIFSIFDQLGAIRKPDSGRIVCKTYIFINSNLLPYKNWKQNSKIFITVLTLLLWLSTIFDKKSDFLQKNAEISKIMRDLVLKPKFSKTAYVCVLTHQMSSF